MNFGTRLYHLYSRIRSCLSLGKAGFFFMLTGCPSLNVYAVPPMPDHLNSLRISMKKMPFASTKRKICQIGRPAIVVKSAPKEELSAPNKGAFARFKIELKHHLISVPAQWVAFLVWGPIFMIPAAILGAFVMKSFAYGMTLMMQSALNKRPCRL